MKTAKAIHKNNNDCVCDLCVRCRESGIKPYKLYEPVDYPERNCGRCGKPFKPKTKKSAFCSRDCSNRARFPKPAPRDCEVCGIEFVPIKSDKRIRFCSRQCSRAANEDRKKATYYASPAYRLNIRMRTGLRRSIGRKKAGRSWEELVGYTRGELKDHLERQFTGAMTWDEFNAGNIHIDHITPLSAFNFDSAEDAEFKRAWSLPNLRPMWAKDNMSKGATIRRLI